MRAWLKFGTWLIIVFGGVVVSFVAQEVWIARGASEIDAMGVRGYIQGASVVSAAWFCSYALRSPEAGSEEGNK